MDGSPLRGSPPRRSAKYAIAALCLALVSVAAAGGVTGAGTEDTCAFLFDFGNGRMQWVDVPVTPGMTGFDVFKNATQTLGLSETHTYQSPYGNTITSIDGYAGNYNFADPKQPYDFWRLWVWDDSIDEWHFSDYLLDGIDAASTPAIAMIYVRDPYIGPPMATPEYRDPWITARGDLANTASDLSYQPSGAEMKWQQELGNGAIDAPIVSAAGKIYALTSGIAAGASYTTDSKLFCLGASGEVLWSAPVGRGHQIASPLLWADSVMVAGADGKLYALDRVTGDQLWNIEVAAGSRLSASPVEYQNLIIVVSDSGTVTAVDQDGAEAWSVETGAAGPSAPALFDGTLFIGSGDGTLYAVAADGSGVQWSAAIGGDLGSPVALQDQVIVTYAERSGTEPSGGGVASVSYEGSVQWKTPTAYTPGSAARSAAGIVAASSQGLSMLSLDGSVQWTASYGADALGGSPVTVNGMTYLVTNESASRIIAVSDGGSVEWTETIDPAANVQASPSISDNLLYMASSGGAVIAALLEGDSWTIPPVGLFTYTVTGTTAHLDASSSYGGNGTLSFRWDFDDGQTASGVKVDHAFPNGGNHTVVLTVTDAAGTSRNLTKTIDLDDPQAQGGPGSGTGQGLPVTIIAGIAVVALLGGAMVYVRWMRRKG